MFEYFKNIFDSYRDRLNNPILGTYTVAFLVCNWRPILILLNSKSSIEDNIKTIDEKYSFLGAVLWPILITVIVVLVVPYLMMGLEYALLKASSYRKGLKNSNILDDYDHRISVASKEFEVQNKKSGTRTIEMMQSNIELLESENQNIINQISQLKDAHQIEINSFENLLQAEKEKNSNKINSKMLEFSASSFDTYNSLEMSGRLQEFLDTYDFFSKTIGKNKLINFYIDLGLMKYKDGEASYTFLADELYYLVFELTSLRDKKKKIISAIDKFNQHEISSIRKVDQSFPSLNIDGFSQPLVLQLSDENFISISKIGEHTLTDLGLQLRNIMGIIKFEK